MLIIISDIHLGDGSCGKSINPAAFHLFTDRLNELARDASHNKDGKYCPIHTLDILLLGDILDPLHSTLWLGKNLGDSGYVRPWTDFHAPKYAAKISEITRAILKNNQESISILKSLTRGSVTIPPATLRGNVDNNSPEIPVNVHLHYMVGNHDWYYHLPGTLFDTIRAEIIDAFGLSNSQEPFPHELKESTKLLTLLGGYKVYAQHGDLFDSFNYSQENGRNASSLGDAFTVEILNRFPTQIEKRMGSEIHPSMSASLRELANVRPALATPLWISSQLRQNNVPLDMQKEIKKLWDEMSNEFLGLDFVQESNIPFKLDAVDGLGLVIHLTDQVSFKTLDSLAVWMRKRFGFENISFAHHALKEKAFLDHKAQFVVYGHTHHHEVVPLDSFPGAFQSNNQIYINSGTWHTYFDLAINKPEEQKFIPYQVLTYLAFYRDDEHQGRHFETWSGSFLD